jgi:catechol 2,3-dioxygenase-like lactoylglutathione lyase family enzyme
MTQEVNTTIATKVVSVKNLDHIVLRVSDPEVSASWYAEKLGLEVLRLEKYRAGEVPFPSVQVKPGTIIDLDGRKAATGINLSHYCLEVEEIDLYALADSGHFGKTDGPHRRWGAYGPADLLYVTDPDGHTIELRHYGPSQVEPGQ